MTGPWWLPFVAIVTQSTPSLVTPTVTAVTAVTAVKAQGPPPHSQNAPPPPLPTASDPPVSTTTTSSSSSPSGALDPTFSSNPSHPSDPSNPSNPSHPSKPSNQPGKTSACDDANTKDCGCGGRLSRNTAMAKIGRQLATVATTAAAATKTARSANPTNPTRPAEEFFAGGLLGVKAQVVLMRQARKARITLSGLPLGGTVTGEARFSDHAEKSAEKSAKNGAEQGAVVVSEPLASVLRRRAIKLVGAEYDQQSDTVKVVARLPIVGTRNIVLKRVSSM